MMASFLKTELPVLYRKLIGDDELIDNIQFERDFTEEERKLLRQLLTEYYEESLKQ